jgi:signal transduction histidine kinase
LHPNGTWTGPTKALRADKTISEQELSLTKLPDGRIVCISRDVSARNALERDRLELSESVNRAHRQEIVNLLAAGLTHDLSNLVTLISHLSDPMLKGFAQDKPAVMEEIHSAARQMVSLLDPIRQLGRRQPVRQDTDLGALLSEAAGILHLGAPIDLVLRTDLPGDPIIAHVDPMELMQVLLNLGLNARDALGDGPQQIDLTLSLASALPPEATLETGVIPDAPFALFTIRDTGHGIPPDQRAQIWEPFFTTKKLRGTGLGLFVVADIVRSAGGAIALTTQSGKGTSFFIAWPLSARPLVPAVA